jgi:transcriptional regulator with XRE-family HTH domain
MFEWPVFHLDDVVDFSVDISSIERGEEILSIETLFKIANALQITTAALLLNANRDNPALGLCDAVDELSRFDSDKSRLLLNLLVTLIDNSNKW